MTLFKKTLGIILSAIIAVSVFAVPTAASAVSTKKVTLLQYTSRNLTFKKAESDSYECKISGNSKNYIKVDASDDGTYFWLFVYSKKTTAKTKPTISVYKNENGSKTLYKKFSVTVTPVKKVKYSNRQFNKNVTKEIMLKNPYEKELKFKYSKKIIKFKQGAFINGEKCYYRVKALKKGSTTVKVYLKGTKKKIGSFKITVGNYAASIKKSSKKLTIKYNKHIKSNCLEGGSINLGEHIKNFHADAAYTFKAKNTKLVSSKTLKKEELTPKASLVFSKKTGKTTLTVYEKRPKMKKKKIGTITLTVKRAKDSEVYDTNRGWDNDGIFYELFASPGDKIDLKSMVVGRYVNLHITGSHFDESEYTFKATSNHPEIVSVDENGVCTVNSFDPDAKHYISYTVTFADGSKASGGGSIDIWSEEDLPI